MILRTLNTPYFKLILYFTLSHAFWHIWLYMFALVTLITVDAILPDGVIIPFAVFSHLILHIRAGILGAIIGVGAGILGAIKGCKFN